jgi:uncharacterized surface protein with fasciclin (FAS1) repeats
MKKVERTKHIIFILFLSLILIACGKLELLKNEDPTPIAAGSNIKEGTIWEFLSATSSTADDHLKALDLYATAIERVGLKELLNSAGEFTVVAPRNDALINFVKSMGYQTVDEVPAEILRNIFLDNILATKIKTFELPERELFVYETLNNDSISFIRQPSSSDPYVVTINSAPTFVSTAIKIRSQNLECNNGIVHVVDTYTNYIPKTQSPDTFNPGQDNEYIFVTKDSYMANGGATNKNSNYGSAISLNAKKAAADFTRRAITQFEVKAPVFAGRIGAVRVGLYVTRVDGDGGQVSLYEDLSVDWLEDKISWNNSPTPGTVALGSVLLKSSSVKTWALIDITSFYLDALAAGKTFINIGINTDDADLFTFGSKELTNTAGQAGVYSPYIMLSPPEVTILKNPINTEIIVDAKKGNKNLLTSELKFEGTSSKNIFFILKDLPVNGYLVINGKPVILGSRFSQEQIEKGAVKYLYKGTGNSDSFTLEAQDYKGGYYHEVLTVNLQIQ